MPTAVQFSIDVLRWTLYDWQKYRMYKSKIVNHYETCIQI